MICALVRNFICSHLNVLSDEALHYVCTDDETESLDHCPVSDALENAGKLRGITMMLDIDREHGFSCSICSTLEHRQLVAIIDGMRLLVNRALSMSYVAHKVRQRTLSLFLWNCPRLSPALDIH